MLAGDTGKKLTGLRDREGMRKLLFLLTGLVVTFANLPASSQAAWETSWEAALNRAEREKKPILLLELFGKLDEKLC